ncbi:MAG: hypothetical protein DRN83_00430 [Hadesarchaea archaeon]|nr:MAG: hypothetical protein DRN83_00430 [Hadesarchaea archaeon]HDI12974.1 hypothetical protein [Hadesarchaea archaeon]
MLFVVEHLEPKLSEWLYLEYSHAAQAVGRGKLFITNVKNEEEFRRLSRTIQVKRERVGELFEQSELLVLDPKAKNTLTTDDFEDKRAVVIGGILGGDPPLGRTKLLTNSLPKASRRNIGRSQFSIDGAVYVAGQVEAGKALYEIPTQNGIEIKITDGHSVILPYEYPLVDGRPFISPKLIAYLKRPWRLSGG